MAEKQKAQPAEPVTTEQVNTVKKDVFTKHGFELHTHVWYQGTLLQPGEYNKLEKVSKEQIERMLKRGDISK